MDTFECCPGKRRRHARLHRTSQRVLIQNHSQLRAVAGSGTGGSPSPKESRRRALSADGEEGSGRHLRSSTVGLCWNENPVSGIRQGATKRTPLEIRTNTGISSIRLSVIRLAVHWGWGSRPINRGNKGCVGNCGMLMPHGTANPNSDDTTDAALGYIGASSADPATGSPVGLTGSCPGD